MLAAIKFWNLLEVMLTPVYLAIPADKDTFLKIKFEIIFEKYLLSEMNKKSIQGLDRNTTKVRPNFGLNFSVLLLPTLFYIDVS